MTVHVHEGARGCGSLLLYVSLAPKGSKEFSSKVMKKWYEFHGLVMKNIFFKQKSRKVVQKLNLSLSESCRKRKCSPQAPLDL